MSVNVSEVNESQISVEEGTYGGKTYHVILPGREEAKAICFRPIFNQPELRCTRVAGLGTSHVGQGACKAHGGADRVMPISNGKYAVVTKHRLQDSVEQYLSMDRAKLLDLTKELATLRAIYDEQMEYFPEPDDENYQIWFDRMISLIGKMGGLIESISRTDSRNTLTAAQVLYFKAVIVDMLLKYIPDPNARDRAVKEIQSRLGGNTSGVVMNQLEYTTV